MLANSGRNLPVLNFARQAKTWNRQISNVNGKQPVSLVLGPFLENRNHKQTRKAAVVNSHSRSIFSIVLKIINIPSINKEMDPLCLDPRIHSYILKILI